MARGMALAGALFAAWQGCTWALQRHGYVHGWLAHGLGMARAWHGFMFVVFGVNGVVFLVLFFVGFLNVWWCFVSDDKSSFCFCVWLFSENVFGFCVWLFRVCFLLVHAVSSVIYISARRLKVLSHVGHC